jgi:hypothetical protein
LASFFVEHTCKNFVRKLFGRNWSFVKSIPGRTAASACPRCTAARSSSRIRWDPAENHRDQSKLGRSVTETYFATYVRKRASLGRALPVPEHSFVL